MEKRDCLGPTLNNKNVLLFSFFKPKESSVLASELSCHVNKKAISTAIIFILLVLNNIETDLKKRIAFLNYDFYQKIFIESFSNNNVVIVDIDEKSIAKVGQFPWRRDIYSKILYNLNQHSPRAIAFDIVFSEEDRQNPQDLLSQLQKESDQLINVEVPNTNKIFIDSFKDYIFINLIGYTW